MRSPTDETQSLLVLGSTYMLTKRFSAKEEKRRVVAAVYEGGRAGFKKHLNYFHRKGKGLDPVFADLRNLHYPSREGIV